MTVQRSSDDHDDDDDDDDDDDELLNGSPTKDLISSWDHCQRFSPSQISNMLQAKLKPVQILHQ